MSRLKKQSRAKKLRGAVAPFTLAALVFAGAAGCSNACDDLKAKRGDCARLYAEKAKRQATAAGKAGEQGGGANLLSGLANVGGTVMNLGASINCGDAIDDLVQRGDADACKAKLADMR